MSPNKIFTNSSIGCLSFFAGVFLVLLILRLINIIAFSWWFIISVLFMPYIIGLFLTVIGALIIQVFRYYLRFKNYGRKRKI